MEQKRDKRAVLLVSFGTRYREARENSLECIYREIVRESGLAVYQAYTSGVVIRKLAEQGVGMDTTEEAVGRLLREGADCLYVLPTHMIPGIEYDKMKTAVERYRTSFKRLEIAGAVLDRKEDCSRVIAVLREIFSFDPDKEYILMGHGTEAEANIRYEQMNTALLDEGLVNVRIASVEAKPELEDMIKEMRAPKQVKSVVLHPFMVVAGDHAIHDMAGEENSFVSRLEQLGYRTEAVIKGLGEYPQFRALYLERLLKMIL